MSCLRQRLGNGEIAMSKKRRLRKIIPTLRTGLSICRELWRLLPGATWAACNSKVSQRKAPGAISAMALMVNPVRLRVFFISGELFSVATRLPP